jgi:hypothetical protein
MLSWSVEEAGRYIEMLKQYETKPPDLIMGKCQQEQDYLSKVSHCHIHDGS